MAVLSFSPPPSGPPSNRLRIGSMQRMSGGAMAVVGANRGDGQAHAAGVEQHADLRRSDEIIARRGQERRLDPDGLEALPEVMVLDLRLQIEDPQGPARRKAEERHARRHVDKQTDQEVALADLGRAAEHQQPARRQDTRRDDVLRHRALVVEQRAQREGRHLRTAPADRSSRIEGRSVFLDMPAAQRRSDSGLSRSSGQLRPEHRGVVAGRCLPSRRRVVMRPSWTMRM